MWIKLSPPSSYPISAVSPSFSLPTRPDGSLPSFPITDLGFLVNSWAEFTEPTASGSLGKASSRIPYHPPACESHACFVWAVSVFQPGWTNRNRLTDSQTFYVAVWLEQRRPVSGRFSTSVWEGDLVWK